MKITLFDRNQALCDEWRKAFADVENVEVACCELSALPNHDILVTPGNSFGVMTGGLDLAVRDEYGIYTQDAIQEQIMMGPSCGLPIGCTITVNFEGRERFPVLVYAPTMIRPSRIHWFSVFQATAAAFMAVFDHPKDDCSAAVPGMGTGVGAVPYPQAAKAMRAAYDAVCAMRRDIPC